MKQTLWLTDLLGYKNSNQTVLSVYLDTDLTRRSKDAVRLTLKEMLEKYDDVMIQKQAARMQKFLAGEYDWQSKGLALFSSGKFWRVVRLPFALTNYATAAAEPYVRPLTDFALGERIGLVVVDRENARFFVSQVGDIREIARVWRATPSRHKQGGENTAARIQRHADTHINQNLKHAATQAVEIFTAEKCAHLMLGGQTEEVALFRAYLPKVWQTKVSGEFAIDVHASAAQIQGKVDAQIEAAKCAQEMELVKAIPDAARKRGATGALGIADTLRALEEKRVMTLAVAEDFRAQGFQCENCGHLTADALKACPVCGHKLLPVDHTIDLAIRKVFEADGSVVTARGDAGKKLKRLGGIGALFRY